MSNKLLILGSGGLGRMTLEASEMLGYECFFLDDNIESPIVCGAKVLGKLDELSSFVGKFDFCICAIGDNKLREKYNQLAIDLGFRVPNIIHKTAYVSTFARIGFGVILLNNVCIQNGAVLGNGVVVTANSEIHHDCVIGDYALIYSCSAIRTFAKIGKRAKIGSTVTISNSVIVPDDTVVENGTTLK